MHVPVLFLGVIFSCTGSNSAAHGGSALLVYFRVKINIPFARLSTVVKSSFEYDVCELQCAAGAALACTIFVDDHRAQSCLPLAAVHGIVYSLASQKVLFSMLNSIRARAWMHSARGCTGHTCI